MSGCLFRFSVWVVAVAVPIADTKESAASRVRHPLRPPFPHFVPSAAPVSVRVFRLYIIQEDMLHACFC